VVGAIQSLNRQSTESQVDNLLAAYDTMKIPDADRAVVDIRKLRNYSLNPAHRTGRHKAHVFIAALGMTADDAEALCNILLKVVREHEADLGLKDSYGQRYQLDFTLEWRGKQAVIRSAWIIESDCAISKIDQLLCVGRSEVMV
jgi:hypothetical protein